MSKGAVYKFPVAMYIWFLDASMGGLLPHTAAPEYSPFSP